MISTVAIGILLYTIPFTIIALHSWKKYSSDRKNSQKKHVYYAFFSWSVGFILDLTGALLVSPDMNETTIFIANTLFTFFDAFNVIGLFWLFIFLKDFVPTMKRYLIPSLGHLAITLIVIFLTPSGFTIVGGNEYIIDRSDVKNLAIILFWFIYWSVIAYIFWKYSKSMTNHVAMRRSQTMSIAAVLAILAYVLVILADASKILLLNLAAEIFAILAGVVFYIGFIIPNWLRKIWET